MIGHFEKGQFKPLTLLFITAFGQDDFDRKARTLLQSATPNQLDVLTKRVLTAKTFDRVFDN
jgi:hypothetical protein